MNAPGRDLALALRPEVEVEVCPERRAALRCAWARVSLGVVGPGLQTALDRLGAPAVRRLSWPNSSRPTGPARRPPSTTAWRLRAAEPCFATRCTTAAGLLARATPTTGEALPFRELPDGTCYQLSRFALLRRVGNQMLLESPTSAVEVELPTSTGTALVAALAEPRTVDELSG